MAAGVHPNNCAPAAGSNTIESAANRLSISIVSVLAGETRFSPNRWEPWKWKLTARLEALAASPRPGPGIVVPFERRKTAEPPAEQGVRVERTTRFEPATLTLARYADLRKRS
jgi:hypothetical protein